MGIWDTLKFALFEGGPVGPTTQSDPGDNPVGDLQPGAYTSIFRDTNALSGGGGGVGSGAGGASNMAAGIGGIAKGAGQIAAAFKKKPGPQHINARDSALQQTEFKAAPIAEQIAVRQVPGGEGPGALRDVEARLAAYNQPREPVYRGQYSGGQSIGGQMVKNRADAAFKAGYRNG